MNQKAVFVYLLMTICLRILCIQKEYKKEIETLREALLQNMKIQLEEATELERQVYVVGTKLQTIADVSSYQTTPVKL